MTVITGSIDHFNAVLNENNIQNTAELMVQPIIFKHEAALADRLGTRCIISRDSLGVKTEIIMKKFDPDAYDFGIKMDTDAIINTIKIVKQLSFYKEGLARRERS